MAIWEEVSILKPYMKNSPYTDREAARMITTVG